MSKHPARLGVLTAVFLALGAAAAPAQTAPDTFDFGFTAGTLGANTGFGFEATFPRERIIDRLTITLPKGSKFNTKNRPQCKFDGDNPSFGRAGDPPDTCGTKSRIGAGKATAILGTARVNFDVIFYNDKNQVRVDIRANDQSLFVSTGDLKGRKMTIPLDLAGEINARLLNVDVAIKKGGKKRKPWLRAPKKCPKSGRLFATIGAREFQGETETTRSKITCER